MRLVWTEPDSKEAQKATPPEAQGGAAVPSAAQFAPKVAPVAGQAVSASASPIVAENFRNVTPVPLPAPSVRTARIVPPEKITVPYIHELQRIFNNIGNRGIVYDADKGAAAVAAIQADLATHLNIISQQWGIHVYVGAKNALPKGDPRTSYNLNSSNGDRSLVNCLTHMGYKVPKITKKNADGDYEQALSAGELAIQRMLQSPEIALKGGDNALRSILAIREMTKLLSSYFQCNFYETPEGLALFLTSYNVVGTLTGRRGSNKHVFQFGNNGQNIPKHGKLAKLYRSCLKARPGHILVAVDQVSAEEWPVNALAENHIALKELLDGTDRHTKLASGLFNIPIQARTTEQWKASIERYLGKKTRHANNYGMKGGTFSDSMAREGHFMTADQCQGILNIANRLEPNIQGVFHKYVRDCIAATRMLRSPFGRERQFLAFRPNNTNVPQFNEAFSWIPQGVVGDNNGFAAHRMECYSPLPLEERFLVQENHDSLMFDVPDKIAGITRLMEELVWAYDRPITFHNGITVNIPVEMEIGYDMAHMVALKTMDSKGLAEAYEKINGAKAKGQLDH